jgi:hypothetical protein
MATADYSMSELLDKAVEQLPKLRKKVTKRRLRDPEFREALLDEMCLKCCEDDKCVAILGAYAPALLSGELSTTEKFSLDLDQLERFLQILIEYLPKLLEIILPLFM